jgi:hypothetical protein
VLNLTFHVAIEQIWEAFSLREDTAEDPLFDVVEVLELNCKNARMVLQNMRHALTCLFGIFFPKRRMSCHEFEEASRSFQHS